MWLLQIIASHPILCANTLSLLVPFRSALKLKLGKIILDREREILVQRGFSTNLQENFLFCIPVSAGRLR